MYKHTFLSFSSSFSTEVKVGQFHSNSNAETPIYHFKMYAKQKPLTSKLPQPNSMDNENFEQDT
jgi:hypothetical protein